MIIGIDPGHGGTDPGAVAGGLQEAALNLELAELFAEGILALGAGQIVQLRTREDGTVTLSVRGERSAAARCDLVLSVHCNACQDRSVAGATFYYMPGDRLAGEVAATLDRCWPMPLRRHVAGLFEAYEDSPGDWLQRPRNVLSPHSCPAVLIEAGFLTHGSDADALQDELVRRAMVPAVVAGVLRFEQLRRRT